MLLKINPFLSTTVENIVNINIYIYIYIYIYTAHGAPACFFGSTFRADVPAKLAPKD